MTGEALCWPIPENLRCEPTMPAAARRRIAKSYTETSPTRSSGRSRTTQWRMRWHHDGSSIACPTAVASDTAYRGINVTARSRSTIRAPRPDPRIAARRRGGGNIRAYLVAPGRRRISGRVPLLALGSARAHAERTAARSALSFAAGRSRTCCADKVMRSAALVRAGKVRSPCPLWQGPPTAHTAMVRSRQAGS